MVVVRDVHAFIDWDTSRRCSWLQPVESAKVASRGVQAQLQAVYDVLGAAVGRIFSGSNRVRPRFYHGWHRGKEPTADRRALVGVDPVRRTIGSVLLEPPIVADTLACGDALRDTLRRRDDGSGDEQKMVDTALCTDLLWLARSESSRKSSVAFIVMSEDDDMVPPVFAARQWGFSCGILRRREANRSMPQMRSSIYPLLSP